MNQFERKITLMEREKGFEPSTLALARRCSTTELFPLARFEVQSVLTSQDTVKLGRVIG